MFILFDGDSGQLSQRMQIPGNMWVEVWQSAKPIPARRQKRLFDDTKEAEKVVTTCYIIKHVLIFTIGFHVIC